ncbi:hypothetical protein ACQ4LE_004475 [Meloidogyne hapla]
MNNKIKFFILFTLLFSFISSNLQPNQRFLIQSKELNKNPDGSNKINLLKMDFNKIDEEGQNKIEILLQVNEENENNIYLNPSINHCYILEGDVPKSVVKNITASENGKKLILIGVNFYGKYRT